MSKQTVWLWAIVFCAAVELALVLAGVSLIERLL